MRTSECSSSFTKGRKARASEEMLMLKFNALRHGVHDHGGGGVLLFVHRDLEQQFVVAFRQLGIRGAEVSTPVAPVGFVDGSYRFIGTVVFAPPRISFPRSPSEKRVVEVGFTVRQVVPRNGKQFLVGVGENVQPGLIGDLGAFIADVEEGGGGGVVERGGVAPASPMTLRTIARQTKCRKQHHRAGRNLRFLRETCVRRLRRWRISWSSLLSRSFALACSSCESLASDVDDLVPSPCCSILASVQESFSHRSIGDQAYARL